MNPTVKSFGDQASSLAQQAEQGAENAIRHTQHLAQQGLDGLDATRAQADSALQQLAHETSALGHRSMDALRESSQQLREKSQHARQATADYIQHEPIKSMLMAAAVGAALMGLVALFSSHRDGGR